MPNYRVYIVDENLAPLAAQTPGELCISGPGLSPGYLNRPELTREKFVPNPFDANPPYHRLYRTGDLARYTASGDIEFLGRIDHQVKLRGFRIELDEIEAAIRESIVHSGHAPRPVAVTLREDTPGLQELIAYIVATPADPFDAEPIKADLRRRLPAYMIPAWFEPIDQLPTLSSGKIDRKRLPTPRRERSADPAAIEDPPQTATEKVLAAAWSRFTNIPAIARTARFFNDLGGHSLLVARLVSDLRNDPAFSDLSVTDLYNFPTINALAAQLDSRRPPQRKMPTPTPTPRPARSNLRRRHALFSIAQFFCLYIVVAFYSLQWLTPYLTYIWMIESDETRISAIGWALGILLAVYPLMLLATIAAKWLLVGRLKPGDYPLWSFFHLRWWLLQRILDAVAVEYLEGTPLLNIYYRLMGAKIGRRVHFDSYNIGAFDLVSVGAILTCLHLGDSTSLLGYTIEEGLIKLARIKVGARCFIGASSVLRPGTEMEDDSRLLHLSMLPTGKIPTGETWFGSPARPLPHPPAHLTPIDRPSAARRFCTTCLHALGVFLLPIVYLAALFPGLVLLNEIAHQNTAEYRLLFAAPIVAVLFIVLLCLEIVVVKWLLLGRVKPGDYSIYGWFYIRKWFVDQLMGLSLDVMGPLYATLYLNPWYRALGAKNGPQGNEISTACARLTRPFGHRRRILHHADAVLLGVPQVEEGILSSAPHASANAPSLATPPSFPPAPSSTTKPSSVSSPRRPWINPAWSNPTPPGWARRPSSFRSARPPAISPKKPPSNPQKSSSPSAISSNSSASRCRSPCSSFSQAC